ncbi:hypothetical protein GQ457_17G011090 [Hibiscus cannabinus]
MMDYIQNLEKLDFPLSDELTIDVILQSLPYSFNQFVLKFRINKIHKTLLHLLNMLEVVDSKMKKVGPKPSMKEREISKSRNNAKVKPKGKNALRPK